MTSTSIQISSDCSVGEECPSLDQRKDGWIEVTGYLVDTAGVRVHDDDTETTVEVPAQLLGERGDLTVADLSGFIGSRHRTDLLRVQTRDLYSVASDGEDFRRYVEGFRFEPSQARKDWAAKLRADKAVGKVRRNVHVVREPLTRFLAFQFEVGYLYNAEAGQDIRILSVGAGAAAAHLMHVGDFTVVEHKDVVRNRYDEHGRFLGAVQASSDAAQVHAALAEVVWESAVPFVEWWAQHPQYHRAMQAA